MTKHKRKGYLVLPATIKEISDFFRVGSVAPSGVLRTGRGCSNTYHTNMNLLFVFLMFHHIGYINIKGFNSFFFSSHTNQNSLPVVIVTQHIFLALEFFLDLSSQEK